MTNYEFSNLEIEEAYDALVATRTPIFGSSKYSNTIVRNRKGEVVFDYSMPDGTDSREGSKMGYQCVGCGQKVADLLAHNTAFHSRAAQETNMQLAGLTPLREQRE